MMIHAAAAAVLAVSLSVVSAARPEAPVAPQGQQDVCSIQTAERVVAVGDIHGAFDKFVAILRESGLIDGRRRWIGGRAILVQTGDILDRGPDSRRALDLIRALTDEAAKAGGRVIPLMGNHEVMRLVGDRRYVSAAEYTAFVTADSDSLRQRAFEYMVAESAKRAKALNIAFDPANYKERFFEDNPRGAVEMQIAFGPKGEYGQWVRQRDLMARINGVVYLHAGVTPAVAALGCPEINRRARAEINGPLPPPDADGALLFAETGPLWWRGLADTGAPQADAVEEDALAGILKSLDATAIVIGHTVSPDFNIRPRFSGRVVQIDTGMLGGSYYPGGKPSALEITKGAMTAIYEGKRTTLTK